MANSPPNNSYPHLSGEQNHNHGFPQLTWSLQHRNSKRTIPPRSHIQDSEQHTQIPPHQTDLHTNPIAVQGLMADIEQRNDWSLSTWQNTKKGAVLSRQSSFKTSSQKTIQNQILPAAALTKSVMITVAIQQSQLKRSHFAPYTDPHRLRHFTTSPEQTSPHHKTTPQATLTNLYQNQRTW